MAMDFSFIKRYLPRSLLGRAVMILLMPVVLLQLMIGAVFISRHFEGVTKQMARGVALEIVYVLDEMERSQESLNDLGAPFQLRLERSSKTAISPGLKRRFYDLSGRYLAETLRQEIGKPLMVDLVENRRLVTIEVETGPEVLVIKVPRRRVSASNPHQLLVLMVVASLVLIPVSVVFLRNQVKPIRRLAAASEEFGKGRTVPFRPAGAEEVRRAGHAFMAMRSRIERHVDQRTQMLSGVSHDLRTPLTRLKLGLEMLDTNPEDVQEMQHDLSEMEKMLDSFLAFARGDQAEEFVSIEPGVLARSLISNMRRTGTDTSFDPVQGDAEPISARKTGLTRGLQNLLSNAARYGNRVRLSLHETTSAVDFIIEDNGPGIPKAEREQAMRAFTRLDEARNLNKGGGVGLGLAIALDIARSHGGVLVLEDSADLGGLRATLRLPR